VSVTRWCCVKTAARIELFFAYGLPSTYATLCLKEIRDFIGISKIKVLPSGLFDLSTPTAVKCVMNSDSGLSGVDSTWQEGQTWQVRFTVDYDRRLLITLGMQLCVQRDGRLSVRQRRAGPLASARVQVSFQQIQLRLGSKCPRLALTHPRCLVKVICFSQGTVATVYR